MSSRSSIIRFPSYQQILSHLTFHHKTWDEPDVVKEAAAKAFANTMMTEERVGDHMLRTLCRMDDLADRTVLLSSMRVSEALKDFPEGKIFSKTVQKLPSVPE